MHDLPRLANAIRFLAIDAIVRAGEGHQGVPLGMAEIATALYTRHLKFDAADPAWPDRDRVVLSNGHGSMLLYSALYLTGQAFTLDDLKRFRQWGSPTAGHPELGEAPGIETTTGPLGQGFANAVGMAIAERMLAARFGDALVSHHTYVLCGDGCLMEGVSAEAASLAGHLQLGKLVVLYDDNQITIDGSTAIAFTEDVAARFAAYGWHTARVDGHDQEAVYQALQAAQAETARPSLICCRTVIGRGSPKLAGTSKSHGSPLGADEVRATKAALGLDPDASFVVPPEVLAWFRRDDADRKARRLAWEAHLAQHADADAWRAWHAAPDLGLVSWPGFAAGEKVSTRKASHAAIVALGAALPNLVGGSADLAESNLTHIKGTDAFSAQTPGGHNLAYGVREHAMAAIANGLSLHGGLVPFCATFMCFHDYMRPSVRLSALMHQPVVYVYTHDSVHLGEDGPTHQPVEHLMAMRSMPNLWVVRPSDPTETVEAWKLSLRRRDGPTALALTRQNLPVLDRSRLGPAEGLHRGAYVLAEAEGQATVVLIATGSEVELALRARDALQADGVPTRVVAMPCWEAFASQDAAYRAAVLPRHLPRVSVEAGVTFGWSRWTGEGGRSVGIDRFGASAPAPLVAEKLGLNVDAVVAAARAALSESGL